MNIQPSGDQLAARPSVLQLALPSEAALHAAYIPVFQHGGLFVPTLGEYRLGDEVRLLVTLPGDERRHPVLGRVAWITPARALGGRTQGIGLHFAGDEQSRQLRAQIEERLAAVPSAERPTQTL